VYSADYVATGGGLLLRPHGTDQAVDQLQLVPSRGDTGPITSASMEPVS
jgi:hypothetical protein